MELMDLELKELQVQMPKDLLIKLVLSAKVLLRENQRMAVRMLGLTIANQEETH